MSANPTVAPHGWRRVVLGTANALRVVLGTGGVLVLVGLLAGPPVGSTTWAVRERAPVATWSPVLAQRFPDCAPDAPRALPGSVIEVGSGGVPVRVDFGDAWRRTHDRIGGNSGRILATCRDGVPAG